MPEQQAQKKARGCVKLRRCSKFKIYYKTQFLQTARNKDRRLNRHLRSHPNDRQARERYGEKSAAGVRLNHKGRKLAKRVAS